MIEKLTNCPQCGGILNEAGRCEFCGSKVYDFLTMDFGFSPEKVFKRPKTYIRIKDSRGIILAPVTVDFARVIIEHSADTLYMNNIPCQRALEKPDISIEATFNVIGDIIRIDTDEE